MFRDLLAVVLILFLSAGTLGNVMILYTETDSSDAWYL